jgi:hypothetical protein
MGQKPSSIEPIDDNSNSNRDPSSKHSLDIKSSNINGGSSSNINHLLSSARLSLDSAGISRTDDSFYTPESTPVSTIVAFALFTRFTI